MSLRASLVASMTALVVVAVVLPGAADAGFETILLPVTAEDLSLVPTHPDLARRGHVAFLAQQRDGKACEVGWVRIVGGEVVGPFRYPCQAEHGFYNLLPGVSDGASEADPMLVAVTPTGITRIAPGETVELVSAKTLVAVAPDRKFPGPLLWQDSATPADGLRIVLPELDGISIWQRVASSHDFTLVERYPVEVRARFDARLGRDTVHPDYHLLANLRMPKFALGAFSEARPRGLIVGVENRLQLVTAGVNGEPARVIEYDLDLFRDDDEGLSVVRGNRLGDFDGDGRLDAVIVAARGGLTNLESRAEVYFAPLEQSLTREPAIRYRLTDAAAGTELVDVDGDGARELYRPTVQISIGAVVRILLFQEVKIEYRFAELVAGDPEQPEWFCTIPRTFSVNLGGVANHPGPLFDLRGDFDGDGITDVVTGTPEDGFDVLFGERKHGSWCVSDRESPVELHGLETLAVARLNGDARWDLIAWTRAGAGRSGLAVLLSN